MELVISSGKSVKQIARELGCSASSLGEWKKKYEQAFHSLEENPEVMSKEELYKSHQALQKELRRVIEEREILKKSVAILGR